MLILSHKVICSTFGLLQNLFNCLPASGGIRFAKLFVEQFHEVRRRAGQVQYAEERTPTLSYHLKPIAFKLPACFRRLFYKGDK
jgi:hypothetical protein